MRRREFIAGVGSAAARATVRSSGIIGGRAVVMRMFVVGWCMSFAAMGYAQTASPALVTPTFIVQDPDVVYYRPVVNASGTMAIFEHTPVAGGVTTLYSIDLTSPGAMPQPF
jgi:hypothetical protein